MLTLAEIGSPGYVLNVLVAIPSFHPLLAQTAALALEDNLNPLLFSTERSTFLNKGAEKNYSQSS